MQINNSASHFVFDFLLSPFPRAGSPSNTLKEKPRPSLGMQLLSMVFSQIFIKCFTLTFLAEWGDRSQISTIG